MSFLNVARFILFETLINTNHGIYIRQYTSHFLIYRFSDSERLPVHYKHILYNHREHRFVIESINNSRSRSSNTVVPNYWWYINLYSRFISADLLSNKNIILIVYTLYQHAKHMHDFMYVCQGNSINFKCLLYKHRMSFLRKK